MAILIYPSLIGVISLFLFQNSEPSLSPSGMSLFDIVDMNNDGIVTAKEALTNPNKAIVTKWITLVENVPKNVVEKGITRKEFYGILYSGPNADYHNYSKEDNVIGLNFVFPFVYGLKCFITYIITTVICIIFNNIRCR